MNQFLSTSLIKVATYFTYFSDGKGCASTHAANVTAHRQATIKYRTPRSRTSFEGDTVVSPMLMSTLSTFLANRELT